VIDTEAGRAIVLGIGINLTNNAFPEELIGQAISVQEATGLRPNREAILSALLPALSRWYALLHEPDGTGKLIAAWISRSSYADGRLVKVQNGDEVIVGITRGLEADGALRLETEGTITTLRAGDVVSVRAN
jgi:BirA family biotin operon repressor/biotin-[acetyl-CoA-carboxylase] ligase